MAHIVSESAGAGPPCGFSVGLLRDVSTLTQTPGQTSEDQFRAELHVSRTLCAEDAPEVRGGEDPVRHIEIRPVQLGQHVHPGASVVHPNKPRQIQYFVAASLRKFLRAAPVGPGACTSEASRILRSSFDRFRHFDHRSTLRSTCLTCRRFRCCRLLGTSSAEDVRQAIIPFVACILEH
jgi:hypothetical protein